MRAHNSTPRASSACSLLISSATLRRAHVSMSMLSMLLDSFADDYGANAHVGEVSGHPLHGMNVPSRRVADASPSKSRREPAASGLHSGQGRRAHQQGVCVHHALKFSPSKTVGATVFPMNFFYPGRQPVDQKLLPLLGRLEGPSVAPAQIVRTCKTYREAVRLAWAHRRVHGMTLRQLAAEAELPPQHISDYLHPDDRSTRRNLSPEGIARFESVVGNTIVTQWIASRAPLTILEELQASRAVA
jgi:hypothetical protein